MNKIFVIIFILLLSYTKISVAQNNQPDSSLVSCRVVLINNYFAEGASALFFDDSVDISYVYIPFQHIKFIKDSTEWIHYDSININNIKDIPTPKYRAVCNRNGKFSQKIPYGKYKCLISNDGYSSCIRNLDISEQNTELEIVTLERPGLVIDDSHLWIGWALKDTTGYRKVKGSVFLENNSVDKEVDIEFCRINGGDSARDTTTTSCNPDGSYDAPLYEGDYDMAVKHPRCATVTKKITVSKPETDLGVIILKFTDYAD